MDSTRVSETPSALELAIRLLRQTFEGGDETVLIDPQLYPGRLPVGPLRDLPVPEKSRVVGSAVFGELAEYASSVILDSDLSPDDVLTYFEEQLPARGWHVLQSSARGFVPRRSRHSYATFGNANDAELEVDAIEGIGWATDLRINVVTAWHDSNASEVAEAIERFLPPLVAPDESKLQVLGNGGSPGEASSAAILQVSLDLANVHRHYVEQLEGTEWLLQRQFVADSSTTSRWSLITEQGVPWKGKLTIARDEEARHSYRLEFVARRMVSGDQNLE